jgi:hypothetical protein
MVDFRPLTRARNCVNIDREPGGRKFVLTNKFNIAKEKSYDELRMTDFGSCEACYTIPKESGLYFEKLQMSPVEGLKQGLANRSFDVSLGIDLRLNMGNITSITRLINLPWPTLPSRIAAVGPSGA